MAKNEDVSGDIARTGEAHVPHAKYEDLIAKAKQVQKVVTVVAHPCDCLLYTSPSPRDS